MVDTVAADSEARDRWRLTMTHLWGRQDYVGRDLMSKLGKEVEEAIRMAHITNDPSDAVKLPDLKLPDAVKLPEGYEPERDDFGNWYAKRIPMAPGEDVSPERIDRALGLSPNSLRERVHLDPAPGEPYQCPHGLDLRVHARCFICRPDWASVTNVGG